MYNAVVCRSVTDAWINLLVDEDGQSYTLSTSDNTILDNADIHPLFDNDSGYVEPNDVGCLRTLVPEAGISDRDV